MKATIVSVVVILALLAGTHLYLSALSKPMKAVENFEQAVEKKDAKTLADIMNSGQKKSLFLIKKLHLISITSRKKMILKKSAKS